MGLYAAKLLYQRSKDLYAATCYLRCVINCINSSGRQCAICCIIGVCADCRYLFYYRCLRLYAAIFNINDVQAQTALTRIQTVSVVTVLSVVMLV